jgi:hypothetical protein
MLPPGEHEVNRQAAANVRPRIAQVAEEGLVGPARFLQGVRQHAQPRRVESPEHGKHSS